MSASSIDWSQITKFYGSLGKENVEKMVKTLSEGSFFVTYHRDIDKFSIQDSSKVHKIALETILSKDEYVGWVPKVLDEKDALGNRLIKLVPVSLLSKRELEFEKRMRNEPLEF